MAILKKIYPFLLIVSLASCEETIIPDMPHVPVLCVNSLLTAGGPVEVSVSKSRLYTDSPEKSEVSDAQVSIYANGELQTDSYIPKEGDDVRIVAESPSVGTGEARVTIPVPIAAPEATWEAYDVEYWRSDGSLYAIQFDLEVNLQIQDPDGENYYRFSFSTCDPSGDNSGEGRSMFELGSLQYDMEPVFNEHIGIFESIMGGEAEHFAFFSDRQFDGKNYTMRLLFNNCWFTGNNYDCPVYLIVSSVSPSFYNWANYIWQYDSGSLVNFGDLGFGDPIWGYSNVSTGAGVVAAQSKSVCSINLSEFLRQTIADAAKQ